MGGACTLRVSGRGSERIFFSSIRPSMLRVTCIGCKPGTSLDQLRPVARLPESLAQSQGASRPEDLLLEQSPFDVASHLHRLQARHKFRPAKTSRKAARKFSSVARRI